MSRSRRWPTGGAAVVLAATTLLGACGDEGGPAPSRPGGADDVVVQVMIAGGFVPPGAAVAAVPTLTVLGDATVITQAPVPAIYPGPAMVPLQATRTEAATVDRLVRRAADLGLLAGPLQFGRPPVADAPDTTVTVVADGRAHTHTAYGLGITDDGPGGGPAALSEQELANRRALKRFLAETEKLPPGDRSWRPATIAVYVLGDYQPEPQLPQPPAVWPLATEPATAGTPIPCTEFRGGDVQVLLDALARANARTPWTVGGRLRSLAFRPVVPGQPGCGNP